MTKAYCYHRFSSKKQEHGASIQRQAELTRALAIKHGWEIAETIEDQGQSAWKGDHLRVGNLGKFKTRVMAGEIERGGFLVIENLDRLSRQDVKKARRWIEEVTEAGIAIAVCNPEKIFDEASLSGENIVDLLQYLLEAQRSTKESGRKSELQKDNIERMMVKARSGIVYNPRGPLWLAGEVGGTFTEIEDRGEVVRQIYEWCAAGLGYLSIAQRLNASVEPWTVGYKSQKAMWKAGYVRDILTSPAVEGEYHIKSGTDRGRTGEIIHGYYPRVVSADLVERARSAMKTRNKAGGQNFAEAKNLFAGLVNCGECGGAMVRVTSRGKTGKQYEYFLCRGSREGSCKNGTQYRYDLFEVAALTEILHLALDDTHFIRADEVGPLTGRLADLNKLIETRTAEQKRLLTFIMKHDDAPEAEALLNELRPQLDKLKRDRDDAQSALVKARGAVSPDEHLRRVIEVRDAIHSNDVETRDQARRKVRDALQSIVKSIEFWRIWRDNLRCDRRIKMTLNGNHLIYHFDGEGNCFAGSNRLPAIGTDFSDKLAAIDDKDGGKSFADIVRRAPDDMKTGVEFEPGFFDQ